MAVLVEQRSPLAELGTEKNEDVSVSSEMSSFNASHISCLVWLESFFSHGEQQTPLFQPLFCVYRLCIPFLQALEEGDTESRRYSMVRLLHVSTSLETSAGGRDASSSRRCSCPLYRVAFSLSLSGVFGVDGCGGGGGGIDGGNAAAALHSGDRFCLSVHVCFSSTYG